MTDSEWLLRIMNWGKINLIWQIKYEVALMSQFFPEAKDIIFADFLRF